jgi:hypothetical protein
MKKKMINVCSAGMLGGFLFGLMTDSPSGLVIMTTFWVIELLVLQF